VKKVNIKLTPEQYREMREEKLAEGRRLATAAIVADLRTWGKKFTDHAATLKMAADRYERGEHEGGGT
jgi:ribosomal protein L16/L10AE